MKLSEADLADKTGLYSIGGVNVPVLMTVQHGTLLLRSYYGDDFDFELAPVGANRFVFQDRIPFDFIPAGAGRSKQGAWVREKISASGTR